MKMHIILTIILLTNFLINASINWNALGKLNNNQILTEIVHVLPEGWHTYWKNPGDSGAKASLITHTDNVTF